MNILSYLDRGQQLNENLHKKIPIKIATKNSPNFQVATWILPKIVKFGTQNFWGGIVLHKTVTGKGSRIYFCLLS